ncbi:MAG TPA: MATE family efflux transporter [Candidatus Acidoferrum sp.]|nr:MATE family efflux transporter [Candidatus Acidoferrum sp.]
MLAASSRDLTWLRRPLAELVRLSWPIAVSMLSYSALTLTDSIFAGRLGPAALAGVGMGGIMSFAFLVFSMGLLRGVKVLVSQAVGAGRPERVPDCLAAGLIIALGLGAATTCLGELLALALPGLAASRAVGENAGAYLAVRALAAPVMLAFVAMRETLYGQGEARAPMVASIIANLVNIALCYVCVFQLELGVPGVAWAAVAGHVVETGTLVGLRGRELLPSLGRGLAAMREVWRLGLPNGLQMMIEVGSFILLTMLIAAMSEAEMAAHQIAIQAIHFSFLPALAVGEAGSVMAGQAVGAHRDDLVLAVARLAMWLAGIYTAACTVLIAMGGPSIARLFTSDAAVLAAALPVLHVAAAFQVADAANIVARGILRGTGDVRFPAVVGIVTAWSLTPPLTWVLGHLLGMGAFGGWLGLCAEILAAAGIFWWRLLRRGWLPAAARARAVLERSQAAPAARDVAGAGEHGPAQSGYATARQESPG